MLLRGVSWPRRWLLAVGLALVSACMLVLFVDALIWSRPSGNADPSQLQSKQKLTVRSPDAPLLLLVSYDGFRMDYLNRSDRLYAFNYLMANGVRTRTGLLNSFVTVTAPNHYSIVTGLHEESHGIIENKFFDGKLNKWFDYFVDTDRTDPTFFGGRPLWLLNQDAGHHSGCVMWVGCDVPIGGRRSTHYTSYVEHSMWEPRVEKLISWFKDPEKPINFGLLYIEQPDALGHQVGPASPEMTRMIEKLDAITGYLLYRLDEEQLLHRMNIIFTSDHGMTSGSAAEEIDIDVMLNASSYRVMSGFGGPNWNLLPNRGEEETVYAAIADKHPRLKVHRKAAIPDSYHYRNNDRVMPLLLEADLHWRIVSGNHARRRDNEIHGYHGYNNSEPEMQPYFIAIGPDFKVGAVVDSFQNVDIYPLICHLLDLTPDSNNGSFERVKHLLKDKPETVLMPAAWPSNWFSAQLCFARVNMVGFVLLIFAGFSVVLVVLVVREVSQRRQQMNNKCAENAFDHPLMCKIIPM